MVLMDGPEFEEISDGVKPIVRKGDVAHTHFSGICILGKVLVIVFNGFFCPMTLGSVCTVLWVGGSSAARATNCGPLCSLWE